jgi:pimeloyl-ACP methyl ester carboxylesterase
MIHGFPESWYSWRHQLAALANAGYHAVAMDVRGYGRSSKPTRVADYRMLKLVADVVSVAEALGGTKDEPITLVGHDWGAPIAWSSALLRGDLFNGVAGLSVPYAPPSGSAGTRPTTTMRAAADNDEFYIEYFQRVGRAEHEIEADVRGWLLGFYWCAGGDIVDGPNIARVETGKQLREKFEYPSKMPAWMSDADLDVYTNEFEHGGFFGPLARYRNVDRDWEDMAAFAVQPIEIPALFIGGSRDGPTLWGAPAIERFGKTLPKLHSSTILEGSGHWIQQERPNETNALLIEFLGTLR